MINPSIFSSSPMSHTPWQQHICHCVTTGPGHGSASQGTLAFCPRDWEVTTEGLCLLLASPLHLGWLLRWERWAVLRNGPPTVGQATDTIPKLFTSYPQCIAEALTGCTCGAQLPFTAQLYRGNDQPTSSCQLFFSNIPSMALCQHKCCYEH